MRDYSVIEPPTGGDRLARMATLVDALWDAFRIREPGDRGYSWVGFYLGPGGTNGEVAAGSEEMILACRQPKPACSPIGLHGVCGRSYTSASPLIVHDVAGLGEGYIACDPRDRSEIVVPLLDVRGATYAVLDVDSFDTGAFSASDGEALLGLLEAARLTDRRGMGAIRVIC